MTANSYPDDGLGEVFLKMSKQGSTLAGMMDAFSIAVSVGLQYGVPLETYVSKFTNMRFEPAGMTDDPDVRMAQSIVDYIFRRLALDFLPFETAFGARHPLGRGASAPPGHRFVRARGRRDGRRGRWPSPLRARWRSRGAAITKPEAAAAARAEGGAQLDRADGDHTRPERRRPALLLLRNEDAPRGQLLPLRGMRLTSGCS